MSTFLPLVGSGVHFWCLLLLYLEATDSQGSRESAKAPWITHDRLTSSPHTDVDEALSSVTPTLKEMSLCEVSKWEAQG